MQFTRWCAGGEGGVGPGWRVGLAEQRRGRQDVGRCVRLFLHRDIVGGRRPLRGPREVVNLSGFELRSQKSFQGILHEPCHHQGQTHVIVTLVLPATRMRFIIRLLY